MSIARPGWLLSLLSVAGFSAGLSEPALAIWPFDSPNKTPVGERAAEVLARAISIPTTNPPGNEREVAAYLVEVAEDADLEAKLVATPSRSDPAKAQKKAARKKEESRALAWARLPGTGTARPIVLLSHLDVVPAEAGEWSSPPFEGQIRDGYVLGRGALDAKGVAVVQLMAMTVLAERDEPLDRDVIWLATPDEEMGGALGAAHVVAQHPGLLGGAEYLLTEGGNIRVGTPDTPDAWGIAVTEKSPCWLELTARGASGHTSTPSPNAAVPRLVAALDAVRRIETRIVVHDDVQRMFRALAPTAPPAQRSGYRDLRKALSDRRFRRRFLGNPARNALVRNTASITVLEGASRTNVAPSLARAQIDARLLPGESCDDFAHAVRNVVADKAVNVEILLSFPSTHSSIDTDLYRAIERVAAEQDPGAVVAPRMIAGFTDAHYFRDIGIVSYGFVPRWLTPEETRGIHGANERVSIENLERGTNTLVAILEELAGN